MEARNHGLYQFVESISFSCLVRGLNLRLATAGFIE